MEVSAEDLASQILAEQAIANPAVNAVAVARAYGIRQVERVPDVREHGHLRTAGEHVNIVVRGNPSLETLTTRQTFTIAHELGHHLLATREGISLDRQVDDPGVERFCDTFASALLMPPSWIRQMRNRPRTFDGVEFVSRRCATSADAATVALNRWAGWACGLLEFQFLQGRWRISKSVLPSRLRVRLNSHPEMGNLMQKPSGLIGLPLLVNGSEVTVPADFRSGSKPRALFDLREIS